MFEQEVLEILQRLLFVFCALAERFDAAERRAIGSSSRRPNFHPEVVDAFLAEEAGFIEICERYSEKSLATA